MYRTVLRPLLFAVPPAFAHSLAFSALGLVEHSTVLQAFVRAAVGARTDPRIAVRVMGLTFPSPIGLAGGFDKNAMRPRCWAALGFGHVELGTVTAQAQKANPAPNLFRLRADHALINRLGFPNDGAKQVAARLTVSRPTVGVPVGVSIGKSRAVPIGDVKAVIADYVEAFTAVRDVADFVVVNVSSPNTTGLRSMQSRKLAHELLAVLKGAKGRSVPILVKIAPDLDDRQLEEILSVVEEVGLAGVVATNTTIARTGLRTDAKRVEAMGAGGLSGAPLRARACEVVQRVRARLGRDLTVVGVGGIERGEHALALLSAGANLVQMYTGLIYAGPGAPAEIAREIGRAVTRAGANNVADLRAG